MGTLGFVLLCIILFAISFGVAFKWNLTRIGDAPYQYLKVKKDDSVWKVEYDLDSGGGDNTKYDLYYPANIDKNKNYALIFYIHGGGFTSGDKKVGAKLCPYYASHGMIAVSANYSLSSKEHPANLNMMYDELIGTIRAVKTRCADMGFNITEMATTGESAGGGLATLLAYRTPEKQPIPIRFVFAQSAPVYFDPIEWGFTEEKDQADFITNMTGKTFTVKDIGCESYLSAIEEISPAAYINENSVPAILGYGPRDIVVPPDIKQHILKQFDRYDVTYDYIEFPNSGHGLLHDLDKSEEYYKMVDMYIEKYFVCQS